MLRVRIRIIKNKKEIETTAIANSGYETDTPEILVPLVLSKKLNVRQKDLKKVDYESPGGFISFNVAKEFVNVMLLPQKIVVDKCDLVISEYENEVIISDALISAFGIVIEDAYRGLWRLRNESSLRESEPPQLW